MEDTQSVGQFAELIPVYVANVVCRACRASYHEECTDGACECSCNQSKGDR